MSTMDTRRAVALSSIVACVLLAAGCGGRDDAAKTKAFVESYDRAMKKIAAVCGKVSKQVLAGEQLTAPQRAAFIIVYGRAAAGVKLDEAPPSLRACRDAAADAFAKLRSATAEVVVTANNGNNAETVGRANAAAPAVDAALRELNRVADDCRRDSEQIDPQPAAMILPYFNAPICL